MILLTEGIWIGNSDDGYLTEDNIKVGAVLNVARDLPGESEWPDVEYAQVGLIDGPGNEVKDYCAAVIVLASMVKRHKDVMVYDHEGKRSFVVGLMYLCLTRSERNINRTFMSCFRSWESMVEEYYTGLVAENIPPVCKSHKEAFDRMPFGVLEALL